MNAEEALVFLNLQRARYAKLENYKLSGRKKHVLAKHLTEILGGETERYEFCRLIFGKASTKNLPNGDSRALLDLMEVEDFNDIPENQTAIRALHQFMLGQVQENMFDKEVENEE